MQSRLTTWRAISFLIVLMGMRCADGAVFNVNSPADVNDATLGDGVCETATGNHVCTLRAALDESNALPGSDTILLQAVTYKILQDKRLDILDSVSIVGAGASSTFIDGNNTVIKNGSITVSQCRGDHVGCDFAHPENVVSIAGLTFQNGGSARSAITNQGNLTVDGCKITHGKNSSGIVPGISNYNALVLNNSSIVDNGVFAPAGDIEGGGLYQFNGTAVIRNSTISGNFAGSGAGIFIDGGKLDIINSTISGNISNGDGAGIYMRDGGLPVLQLSLYNTTVAFNLANADDAGGGIGGGVYNASPKPLNVVNSIIAMNAYDSVQGQFVLQLPSDCAGTITSQGQNIVGDVDAQHCTVLGPVTIADPLLGPLQANGGPTATHALAFTSPAIDAGNPAGCTDNLGAILTADQRGAPRPSGKHCDIGAFESTERIFSDGFEP